MEILSHFYDTYTIEKKKTGWVCDFKEGQFKGIKLTSDLINADTGEVAIVSGTKVTPRLIKKVKEAGLNKILYSEYLKYKRNEL